MWINGHKGWKKRNKTQEWSLKKSELTRPGCRYCSLKERSILHTPRSLLDYFDSILLFFLFYLCFAVRWETQVITAALNIQQRFMGKYKLTHPKMCVRPRSTERRLFGLKGEKNLPSSLMEAWGASFKRCRFVMGRGAQVKVYPLNTDTSILKTDAIV